MNIFEKALTTVFVVGFVLVVYGILTQGCNSASFGIYN